MLVTVLSCQREYTMKPRIPVLIFLLLLLVGCGERETQRRKAYASLDTVIRLYESGVDTIDAELLEPGAAWFPSKGDASTKGRL